MTDREQKIRERAHQLWEQEGRPDGADRDHWERASRELEAQGDQQEAGGIGPGPEVAGAKVDVGAATGLQPGGTTPGGGPGTSAGSIGTGGGSTAGAATGSARGGRP